MIWNQVRLNALLNVIDFYDSMFSFSNNLKRNKDTKIIEVSQELFENVCSIKIDDKPLITVSTKCFYFCFMFGLHLDYLLFVATIMSSSHHIDFYVAAWKIRSCDGKAE